MSADSAVDREVLKSFPRRVRRRVRCNAVGGVQGRRETSSAQVRAGGVAARISYGTRIAQAVRWCTGRERGGNGRKWGGGSVTGEVAEWLSGPLEHYSLDGQLTRSAEDNQNVLATAASPVTVAVFASKTAALL